MKWHVMAKRDCCERAEGNECKEMEDAGGKGQTVDWDEGKWTRIIANDYEAAGGWEKVLEWWQAERGECAG